MREIKFRAWHKEHKSWFPSFHITPHGFVVDMRTLHFVDITDDVTLMQYTGLKDKNGVEIYEGDIFRFYSSSRKATCVEQIKWMFDPTMLDCEGEVIGNIYENPELLQEAA